MNSGALRIDLCGEQLLLYPQKAVGWPARRTLIIADPHFGKDDVFRRAGIALPRGPAIADLQRLSFLINHSAAERLVVLGDFLHSATQTGDSFLHAFRLWRQAHTQLTVEVVAGNHDRREQFEKWSDLLLWQTRPRAEAPFVFAHEPEASADGYVLAGHLHPVLNLRGSADAGGRVPVFWTRQHSMVLPSFGSFTGGMAVRPSRGDKVYVAAPERVFELAA